MCVELLAIGWSSVGLLAIDVVLAPVLDIIERGLDRIMEEKVHHRIQATTIFNLWVLEIAYL